MNPTVKSLLQNKKYILVYKCEDAGLTTCGTKAELAIKLAKYQEENFSKAWKTISGRSNQ